jgi:putative choline sulfate-utilization transcription factor
MYEALGDVSLDLLRAFEAAARHRSFTAAAVELGTTQPAISQQIKRLEEQLGPLFDRSIRGIELTEGGAILFEQVQLGLQAIDAGLSAISTQQQHEVLQVATDFAFAAYWLMPRLHRFHEANPKVDVSLVTSERNHNMLRTDIDVAILFGDGRFKQGESHWLFSEEVFPVCSPQLKERALPLPAQALLEFRCCICAENSSNWFDWSGLFRELGISPASTGAVAFRQLHLLIQAAIGGQGVAIGWRHLVDNLLSQGLLCRPIAETTLSRLGYYVVLPQRKRRGALIQQFVDWLMAEQASSAES